MQRGAEALYSEEGREQVRALIDHYMGNARILSEGARAAGFAGTWRHQCALHLGGNAARPNELANLRLDAAEIERRYNPR